MYVGLCQGEDSKVRLAPSDLAGLFFGDQIDLATSPLCHMRTTIVAPAARSKPHTPVRQLYPAAVLAPPDPVSAIQPSWPANLCLCWQQTQQYRLHQWFDSVLSWPPDGQMAALLQDKPFITRYETNGMCEYL
jgi:hypothetical protein